MPFFAHGDTKNKLLLLYILSVAETPLTHDQLYRVVDRTDSMTFFAFETALPELEAEGLVAAFVRPYGDCFGLTDGGQESVALFSDSIPASLREAIDRAVSETAPAVLREKQTTSRISGNERDGYSLELLVLNGEEVLFGVTLAVASKEAALEMRRRWATESEALYDTVWNRLYRPTGDGAKEESWT